MRDGFASSRSRWVATAVAVGALAYAAACYALMTRAQDSAWSLAITIGPLLVVSAAWAWNAGHRVLAVAGGLGAVLLGGVLLGLQGAGGQGIPSRWLYLAQHAGVHLALGAWFGATLWPGATPLVTALARRVHEVTPAMEQYTRRVTLAWTLYFVVMAVTSLVLFALGDFAHWSLLANILTPVFTVAFFVGEYLLRYRLHPEFERVSLQRALHAYRSHTGRSAKAPQGDSRT
ncbi:hypothetical protein WG902_01510 [Ramlibacter sp. PS3R-8]|uniref:hypothetical protein n=1 Tax=Ramlibacter sp. PS3R-8 TaxID=3133437 RepID=UPI0030B01027